jgi:hypothetical protein
MTPLRFHYHLGVILVPHGIASSSSRLRFTDPICSHYHLGVLVLLYGIALSSSRLRFTDPILFPLSSGCICPLQRHCVAI